MDAQQTSQIVSVSNSRGFRLWQVMLAALAFSLVANLIVLYFTKPLAADFMSLSLPTVTAWTVIGVLGAWGVFAFIRRRSQNPNRTFIRVSLVVLILSFIPDVLLFFVTVPGFTGVTAGGIYSLMSMHVVTAAIVVPLFVRFTKPAIPR